VIFVEGYILLVNNKGNDQYVDYNNVTIVDGKQIVEINAKGGYFPRISQAKADIPTIIRFNTSNTFDCSASIRIPSVGVSKILPNTGSTDIDIGVQKAGKFRGSCGMGMYPFEIEFVN
jgi:plastocyanin domain-containing protein